MTRGGAQFSKEELITVISRYNIGLVEKLKPLHAGSRMSPKKVLVTNKGIFLLKRRSKGKTELEKVKFAHKVINYLYENNFPVAELIPTLDDDTFLVDGQNVYEMFRFVHGQRFTNKPLMVKNVGGSLGQFHKLLENYQGLSEYRSCFHDSERVRHGLNKSGSEDFADRELSILASDLLTFYNDSARRVNELGFEDWSKQIIHGDWHPGNLIFDGSDLVAVIDFDSVKYGDPITDLANAALQFSIVAGRPNPKDWPDYLDEANLITLITGYYQENEITDTNKLLAIPDLMIETMIAEAILPIAATGYFAHFSGKEFLKMILRKADWVSVNRETLRKLILSVSLKYSVKTA